MRPHPPHPLTTHTHRHRRPPLALATISHHQPPGIHFLTFPAFPAFPSLPANAVDYIKRYMGAPTGIDVEAIKAENARLKAENKELRTQIEEASAAAEEDAE